MIKPFDNVADVSAWRLCVGCGLCVDVCPENNISLVNINDRGLRPACDIDNCKHCHKCLSVCPGIELLNDYEKDGQISSLIKSWGPILEIWEGYASDRDIRYKGSSGGVVTALEWFCIREKGMAGVLHIKADEKNPCNNIPTFSKTKKELLGATGSRYAPAAPCMGIDWMRNVNGKCVFVGKPCDVAAFRKIQSIDEKVDSNAGLAISLFCAGTPSSAGTKRILSSLGWEQCQVDSIRYRDCGWPGMTTVTFKNSSNSSKQITYERSWGQILCNYVQLRCRLCPDNTGQFADISCGDPWYKETDGEDIGRSLVLVRNDNGKDILHQAMEAGYVQLKKVGESALINSQKPLLNSKRQIWGRLLMLKMLNVPVPNYRSFHLFSNWYYLSFYKKIKTLLGTVRRAFQRGWRRRLSLDSRVRNHR